MSDTAAERAARADGIVRDVAHDRGQEAPKRPIHHRLVKSRVADARTDGEPVAVNGKSPQRRHAVDVYEVAGAREAECHDRNQALATGEDASVLTGNLGQGSHRLVDGRGCVVLKWRGLHRSSPRTRWASTITADCP